jgi:hypothetical protein
VRLTVQGYRGRKRTVTLPRVLFALIVLAGLGFWLWPRLRVRRPASAAAKGVAAQPSTPKVDAGAALGLGAGAVAGADAPARPAPPAEDAEFRSDIQAFDAALSRATQDLAVLSGEITKAEGEAGGALPRDFPFRVQQIGAAADHVPMKSLEVRAFQTRLTRIFFDASRAVAERAHAGRGKSSGTSASGSNPLAATSEAMRSFQVDWDSFKKKHAL